MNIIRACDICGNDTGDVVVPYCYECDGRLVEEEELQELNFTLDAEREYETDSIANDS